MAATRVACRRILNGKVERDPRMLKSHHDCCRVVEQMKVRMTVRFDGGIHCHRRDEREEDRSASSDGGSARVRLHDQEAISLRGRYGEPEERGE